jgi:hypothetical protein
MAVVAQQGQGEEQEKNTFPVSEKEPSIVWLDLWSI